MDELLLKSQRAARSELLATQAAAREAFEAQCASELEHKRPRSAALFFSAAAEFSGVVLFFDIEELCLSAPTSRRFARHAVAAPTWPTLVLHRFPWLRELLGSERIRSTSILEYRNLCRRQVRAKHADLSHLDAGPLRESVLTWRPCRDHSDGDAFLEDVVVSVNLDVGGATVFEASAPPRFNDNEQLVVGPFWTHRTCPPAIEGPENHLRLTIYVSRRSLLSTVKIYAAQATTKSDDEEGDGARVFFRHTKAPSVSPVVQDLLRLAPTLCVSDGQIRFGAYRYPPFCFACERQAARDPDEYRPRFAEVFTLDPPALVTYLRFELPW